MTAAQSGIVGVTGREPIGATLAIGRRDRPNGPPVEKDRFHLLYPHEINGLRPQHPDFAAFNAAPAEARRVVGLVFVSPAWYGEGGALQQSYLAQKLSDRPRGDQGAPGQVPVCVGDGVSARRYFGEKGSDDWRHIPCPGEACPYRQPVSDRQGADCKPTTRLIARLDWPEPPAGKRPMPSSVVRFASRGWDTYRAVRGMYESVAQSATMFGVPIEQVPPFGLRFRLLVQDRTRAAVGSSPGRRYPVTVASLIDSAVDHVQRVLAMGQQIRALTASAPLLEAEPWAEDVRALTVDATPRP